MAVTAKAINALCPRSKAKGKLEKSWQRRKDHKIWCDCGQKCVVCEKWESVVPPTCMEVWVQLLRIVLPYEGQMVLD